MCVALIWFYVSLGNLETLPQVCVPDFHELSISNIDCSYESLYFVLSCTDYFDNGAGYPLFSHLVLTGHVLHFQYLDWEDPWESCCCSVLLADAFDIVSLSCTVECGLVAPYKVVISILIF